MSRSGSRAGGSPEQSMRGVSTTTTAHGGDATAARPNSAVTAAIDASGSTAEPIRSHGGAARAPLLHGDGSFSEVQASVLIFVLLLEEGVHTRLIDVDAVSEQSINFRPLDLSVFIGVQAFEERQIRMLVPEIIQPLPVGLAIAHLLLGLQLKQLHCAVRVLRAATIVEGQHLWSEVDLFGCRSDREGGLQEHGPDHEESRLHLDTW
mmetsp:Transcript_15585/g.23795  ORF Transcript_15585/g.23795 Transcript_15585/m.23795 type:complete len:207 (+) Transcript_15585:410-1030(+)